MKRIFIGMLALVGILSGDTTHIMPYVGTINYNNSSVKSSATLCGIKGGREKISFDYLHQSTKYKDINTSNITKDNILLIYKEDYKAFALKGGVHYISTADTILGNATVLLGSIEKDYGEKNIYGIEGYISSYEKDVKLVQLTPYYIKTEPINANLHYLLEIKLNYIYSNNYGKKHYVSLELGDTLYYKKFFIGLKLFQGKMRNGIKESGHIVYNSKDLLKEGFTFKAGYRLKTNLSLNASYSVNKYKEYNTQNNTSSSIVLISIRYDF